MPYSTKVPQNPGRAQPKVKTLERPVQVKIYLPRELDRQVEIKAVNLDMSKSRFFAEAVAAFLKAHSTEAAR